MAHLNLELINKDFCFVDNPVVVKAHTLGFQSDSIFRQVVFRVDTYIDKMSSNHRHFVFSVNADDYVYLEEDSFEVSCDISSALRSALAYYVYDGKNVVAGNEITYPMLSFSVSVFTKEMVNTVVEESDLTPSETYKAFLGGMSERERWKDDMEINCSPVPRFSTKPSGELFEENQIVCASEFDSENDVIKSLFSVYEGESDNRSRATILFVNSRGVYETISVLATESEEYEIDSEVRSIVGATAYRPSPSIISHKEGGGAVWKMSSGYVNKEWAQWYAREFLMAKRYWLRMGAKWIPIAILPDKDSVMTYDKNDPSLVAIDFTVRSAIKG